MAYLLLIITYTYLLLYMNIYDYIDMWFIFWNGHFVLQSASAGETDVSV